MTPSATLRRATPGDAAKLALVGQATFLAAFAHDHPGDDLVAHCHHAHSIESYARLLDDPAHALWLMEGRRGAPVGYAVMGPPRADVPHEPGDLQLQRIYVLGPWQGAGWGLTMLDAALAEARARRARRLLLCVYEENRGAQRFYARHGFDRVGALPFSVGAAIFTDHLMARSLEPF